MDFSNPAVASAVRQIASMPRCLGVLSSVPCRTWSASRSVPAGGGLQHSRPLRDCDNPLGFRRADGSLPPAVETANALADLAADAMSLCLDHQGFFIAEAPVSRGRNSPFAIRGRETHIGPLDRPSLAQLRRDTQSDIVYFDQCRTREHASDGPQKSTALLCSPTALPHVRRLFGHLVCNHPFTHTLL